MNTNYNEVFLKKYWKDESFRDSMERGWKKEFFDSVEEKVLFALLFGFKKLGKNKPLKNDLLLEVKSKSKYEKIRDSLIAKIETVDEIDLSQFSPDVLESQFIDLAKRKQLQESIANIVESISETGRLDYEKIRKSYEDFLSTEDLDQTKKEPLTESFLDTVSRDYPPLNWVVKDILPEGLALLVGRPKLGKSLLAIDIMLGVALGKKVLGRETMKGNVLAAFLEDNGRRLKERKEKNLMNESFDPEDLNKITRIISMPTIDQGGLKMIEDLLRENPETKLVIIDTLGKIKPISSRNENVYLADVALLSPFQTLAQKYHACIMFIHHQNKMKAADIMDSVNGTTGLGGTADSILFLHKKDRLDEQAKLFVVSRETDTKELILTFDKERLKWNYLGDAGLVDKNETKQEILDLLKDGKARTNKEISRDLGKNFETTRKRVKELFDQGLLVRGIAKKDSYSLPEVIEMAARVEKDLEGIL